MEELLLLGILSQNGGSGPSGGGAETDAIGSDGNSLSRVTTPTFSPPVGLRTSNSNITITTTTPDATIYYTTDDSTPSSDSTIYTGPIQNVWALSGKPIRAIAVRSGYEDSEVTEGLYNLPVLKTGQDGCWNGSGSPTNCIGTGQDGDIQPGIARNYTDNGNGTITDDATGLTWQKCSRGQNNDSTCSGPNPTEGNWTSAVDYCNGLNLAGQDWRLPSRLELETLIYLKNSFQVINSTYFPSTTFSANYWTFTDFVQDLNRAWSIGFNTGNINWSTKNSIALVMRCVSGPEKNFQANFSDNGDGTILDNSTGLVWQKCTKGQNNDPNCSGTAEPINWQNSINYCNNLDLANRTWRLPSINELKTLIDLEKSTEPAIDLTVFPATAFTSLSRYWSSTSSPNRSAAYTILFRTGDVTTNAIKTDSTIRYVRCVSEP